MAAPYCFELLLFKLLAPHPTRFAYVLNASYTLNVSKIITIRKITVNSSKLRNMEN
jgi:hypothetical protein